MAKFNYNKRRHLELLKLKHSEEKVLDPTERLELSEYAALVDATLDWETKEQYVDLLEELLSGKIDSFKFYVEFTERNYSNAEVYDSLEANFLLLSPHEKSKEFSDFIIEITTLCNSYCEVFESYPGEDTDSDYLEFRNSIKEIYLRIQTFLNEE